MGSLAYQLRCSCHNSNVSCKAKFWLYQFVNVVRPLQCPCNGRLRSSSVTGKACTLLENENCVELYRTHKRQSISQSQLPRSL